PRCGKGPGFEPSSRFAPPFRATCGPSRKDPSLRLPWLRRHLPFLTKSARNRYAPICRRSIGPAPERRTVRSCPGRRGKPASCQLLQLKRAKGEFVSTCSRWQRDAAGKRRSHGFMTIEVAIGRLHGSKRDIRTNLHLDAVPDKNFSLGRYLSRCRAERKPPAGLDPVQRSRDFVPDSQIAGKGRHRELALNACSRSKAGIALMCCAKEDGIAILPEFDVFGHCVIGDGPRSGHACHFLAHKLDGRMNACAPICRLFVQVGRVAGRSWVDDNR